MLGVNVLFLLYVLSTLPVYWILFISGVGVNDPAMQVVNTFYKPLIWLSDVEIISDFSDWYQEFLGLD